MSILRKALLSFCGILVTGTVAAAGVKAVPIDPPPLDGKRAPSNPLVPWLAKDGSYGYADRDGVVKIAPRFSEARLFYEGFAAVGHDGKWGFIQPSGEFQIAPRYADVSDFLDGQATTYLYSEGVSDPIWGKPLISGTVRKHTVDRRGRVLKEDVIHGTFTPLRLGDRMFSRYPQHSLQAQDWDVIRLPDGKWAAKRIQDGRQYVYDDLITIVRDALSGAATFIAVREAGNTWKVLSLNGKQIASGFGNVHEVSSEGCFIANQKPHYQYAAFDAGGRRLTPAFAQHAFVFYDGIAEATVPLSGAAVFVDRTGRIYAYPEFVQDLEDRVNRANGGK